MYWKAVGPHRFKFRYLGGFGGTYIYSNHHNSIFYKILCVKHIHKLCKNMCTVLTLMLMAHAIITVGPIYSFFFQHILITPMATNLPFFEKDSELEFVVNILIQAIMSIYLIAGTIVIEIGTCFINNVITATPDVIRFHLMEFEHEFKNYGMCIKSIARLRNVFIQVQDFDRLVINLSIVVVGVDTLCISLCFSLHMSRYIKDVIDVYYARLFVGPFVYSFSISLSIIAQLIVIKHLNSF